MITEDRVQQQLAAGDHRAAAEEAIRGLGPEVLRYLRAMLRDEDAAAEAFSQFAERLWKGLKSFRGESSLRTWALRLAVNVVANMENEAWRKRARRLQTGEISAIADDVRTSSIWRVERETRNLDKLRRSLSTDDQSLLVLRLDQRLSWVEIARILSADGERIRVDALCKRFERLKERLARLAKDQGLLE